MSAVAHERHSARAPKALRILIVGGTGFAGSHQVHSAIARGHKVTVFSRGEKKIDLPDETEIIVGDRYKDLRLIGKGEWDAVIDFAAFAPLGVRTLNEALKGRVDHYTLISTVEVYEHPEACGTLTEASSVRAYKGSEDPYSLVGPKNKYDYGALKVLCELESDRQMPGRSLILRPGYIAGPGEDIGQFAYWTLRLEKGGEVLVAGEPSTPVQLIDARDMADWCIRMVENRATGVYNATGPSHSSNLGEFINAARVGVSSSCRLTWVPASWIAQKQDAALWGKLLFWSQELDGSGWAMRMNIERALAMGLTFRQMSVTKADAVAWFRRQPSEHQESILAMYGKRSGTEPAISWEYYLEKEQQALAEWNKVKNDETG